MCEQLTQGCHVTVSPLSLSLAADFVPVAAVSAFHIDEALPRALMHQFGERAFSHAGPSAWNALPEKDIRATSDSADYR